MDEAKVPKIVGRYEIKSELGRGGMSTVYRAFDPNVDRTVALKLLPREFLHHKEFRARFNREARIIAALEHSAIVPIYDFGDVEGQPYFVMRFMAGGSLAQKIDAGPMQVEDASKIIERIGSALQYAHSKGVVHRDLKPGNILFDQFGTAYLADFGIARLEETGATLTGSVFMGTPAYMSPEQVQAVHDLDGRADIYALGVILYEMLTGTKPYRAKTAAATALKHITEPVPRILEANPNLPSDMEQVIRKAMAKNPEERYLVATDLTKDVTTLAAGRTIVSEEPPAIPGEDLEATMIAPASMATPAPKTAVPEEKEAEEEPADDATAVVTPAEPVAPPAEKDEPEPEVARDTVAAAASVADATGQAARPATQPPVEATEQREGRSRILTAALIGLGVIICLGAIGAAIVFAGDGGLGALFGGEDTATPTETVEVQATETDTATATATATATEPPATGTSLPTATNTPTGAPTDTPLAEPTLRPTNTPEPTDTATPTRRPATFTPTPIPPSPTSPPPPPTQPPPPPTSPPPPPTEPPPVPTEPRG